MTNMRRRIFLKSSVATGTIGAIALAGLLTPRMVLAAWPKTAFESKNINKGISSLYSSSDVIVSDKVHIEQSGYSCQTLVPVTVTTSIDDISSISLFAENNTTPLTAVYSLSPRVKGYVSMNIYMEKPGNIIAVVKAGDKLYSAKKHVQVTIGGCGKPSTGKTYY